MQNIALAHSLPPTKIEISRLSPVVSLTENIVTTLHFSSDITHYVIGNKLIIKAVILDTRTLALSLLKPQLKTNINISLANGDTHSFILNTYKASDMKLDIITKISVFNSDGTFTKVPSLLPEEKTYDYEFDILAKDVFSSTIAPKNIWTDGRYTYLDFRSPDTVISKMPIVHQVEDWVDTPVNSTLRNGILIVHSFAKQLTLRSGSKIICIQYKGKKYNV